MASFLWQPLLASAALHGSIGVGAGTLPSFTGSGASKQGFFGTGAAILPQFTSVGASKQGFFAAGAGTIPSFIGEGSASLWSRRVSLGLSSSWADRPAAGDPSVNWTARVSAPSTTWTDRP